MTLENAPLLHDFGIGFLGFFNLTVEFVFRFSSKDISLSVAQISSDLANHLSHASSNFFSNSSRYAWNFSVECAMLFFGSKTMSGWYRCWKGKLSIQSLRSA